MIGHTQVARLEQHPRPQDSNYVRTVRLVVAVVK